MAYGIFTWHLNGNLKIFISLLEFFWFIIDAYGRHMALFGNGYFGTLPKFKLKFESIIFNLENDK